METPTSSAAPPAADRPKPPKPPLPSARNPQNNTNSPKSNNTSLTALSTYATPGNATTASQSDGDVRGVGSVGMEDPGEVWVITPELRGGYLVHFHAVHPVDGYVPLDSDLLQALFRRSNLPEDTLARIWKLADIDRDGRLDEDEFCIAMQLARVAVHFPNIADGLKGPLNPRILPPFKKQYLLARIKQQQMQQQQQPYQTPPYMVNSYTTPAQGGSSEPVDTTPTFNPNNPFASMLSTNPRPYPESPSKNNVDWAYSNQSYSVPPQPPPRTHRSSEAGGGVADRSPSIGFAQTPTQTPTGGGVGGSMYGSNLQLDTPRGYTADTQRLSEPAIHRYQQAQPEGALQMPSLREQFQTHSAPMVPIQDADFGMQQAAASDDERVPLGSYERQNSKGKGREKHTSSPSLGPYHAIPDQVPSPQLPAPSTQTHGFKGHARRHQSLDLGRGGHMGDTDDFKQRFNALSMFKKEKDEKKERKNSQAGGLNAPATNFTHHPTFPPQTGVKPGNDDLDLLDIRPVGASGSSQAVGGDGGNNNTAQLVDFAIPPPPSEYEGKPPSYNQLSGLPVVKLPSTGIQEEDESESLTSDRRGSDERERRLSEELGIERRMSQDRDRSHGPSWLRKAFGKDKDKEKEKEKKKEEREKERDMEVTLKREKSQEKKDKKERKEKEKERAKEEREREKERVKEEKEKAKEEKEREVRAGTRATLQDLQRRNKELHLLVKEAEGELKGLREQKAKLMVELESQNSPQITM